MNEAENIYLMIDNVYYRFKNSKECKEKELKLFTFNIEEFIAKCLEKIDDDNNKDDSSGTTNAFSLELSIKSLKIELLGSKEKETDIKDMREYIKNKTSEPSNVKINGNNTDLSFFLIFLSIFFGMPLTEEELKKIQDEFIEKQKGSIPSNKNDEGTTSRPTIDEFLKQIEKEEQEAAKQNTKSLRL